MDPLLVVMVEMGVITPADADRIHRQMDPEAARLHAEETLAQAFQRGFGGQRRRILDLLDTTQGNPTPRQLDRLWGGEDELLFASVEADLVGVALEQAIRASIDAEDDQIWEKVNNRMMTWARLYYNTTDRQFHGSIPNLNQTSRQQFFQVFEQWQRGELREAGYNRGLPDLIRALEPTFGESRSRRIAITETSRIFAESERQAAGENDFVVYLQWLTANDELVCPICGPRADLVIGKEEDGFRVAEDFIVGFPPAHVNCRCSITQLTEAAYQALRDRNVTKSPDPLASLSPALRKAVEARQRLAERVKDVTYSTTEGKRIREKLLKATAKQDQRARDIFSKYSDRIREARNAFFDATTAYDADDPRTIKARSVYDKLRQKRDEEMAAARAKALEVLYVTPKEKRFGSYLDYYLDPRWIHTSRIGKPPTEVLPQHRAGAEFLNRIGDHGVASSVKIHYEPGRAYHSSGPDGGWINLDPTDTTAVAVHELGHRIELLANQDQIKVQRFLHDRIGDELPQRMLDYFPTRGYHESEVAYKDRFDHPYTGKVYGDFEVTEVVSMGVQYLYDDPVGFANRDPEYFDFVVSYMRRKV